jgi:hypothetical protein
VVTADVVGDVERAVLEALSFPWAPAGTELSAHRDYKPHPVDRGLPAWVGPDKAK